MSVADADQTDAGNGRKRLLAVEFDDSNFDVAKEDFENIEFDPESKTVTDAFDLSDSKA